MDQQVYIWQWILIVVSSIALYVITPFAKTQKDFFKGSRLGKEPGFWMLTSSLVISWIFAKSITNAANLGQSYGIVGGVAYAAYYLSFLVAGITIYFMRVKGGWNSIHDFLENKFGKSAILLFSILISFRLLNEVWSNTMVIGSYFGAINSGSYFIAIIVFTLLTLAYTIKGGLRSSLLTDAIQMILFAVLLISILAIILPKENMQLHKFIGSGEWTSTGGINLLFVALIQVFSYPFHDPVMTDRAFIASPKKTLKSFFLASVIGSISIVLFSFIGIYGSFNGSTGQAAVEVSKMFGTVMMLLVNFIMVTSAASTLDSAFNSFSKMTVIDLKIIKPINILNGRRMIVLACLIGTIPIFLSPDILSATTISGTMVIGLTPIFALWFIKAPKISFHLSVLAGILLGILFLFEINIPYSPFEGPYNNLLAYNIIGIVLCFILYLVPIGIKKLVD